MQAAGFRKVHGSERRVDGMFFMLLCAGSFIVLSVQKSKLFLGNSLRRCEAWHGGRRCAAVIRKAFRSPCLRILSSKFQIRTDPAHDNEHATSLPV